ncbi:alpha/beta hydrolase [Nonomuraea sp. NPDC049784]|uniref:alpha/beta hydrolase n=1 Tax=Nonomuraea sp. NPDC049784 TaxID=3154361 RepID=UPI0033D92387
MPIYNSTNVPEKVGRDELDKELADWLPRGPILGADERIADARRSHRVLAEGPWPTIGSVETLLLPGPHGSVPVRVHTPSTGSGPYGALVYLHGGGWTVGTLDEFEIPMRIFAERAGIKTYAIDYQLAPEAKFPVQLDECGFVISWLFAHAADQEVDPERIAVGGDSAGGNMTCALTLKFRDEGGPRLALQLPLYPETALPFDTDSGSENRVGFYLETYGVLLFAWNYVPHHEDARQPLISPLNASSHDDLPPAVLVTNGYDPLRDVGHAYARKLASARNDLTYIHHTDLTHGFIQFTRHSKRCLEATHQIADVLKEKIGG